MTLPLLGRKSVYRIADTCSTSLHTMGNAIGIEQNTTKPISSQHLKAPAITHPVNDNDDDEQKIPILDCGM